MRLGLVFTDDWELFGNGSGSVQQQQVEPVNRFMAIAEEYDAPYTIMAEVGQHWAYQANADRYPQLKADVELWETTLKQAIQRGHDVQLHIHPQWQDARFNGKEWQLDYTKWSLPHHSPEMIKSLIKRGKKTLEDLLQPVNPAYQCCCFRAGAWLMQPSSPLIDILTEEGIVCDSSVVQGSQMAYKWGSFDYQTAHSNLFPWWADHQEVSNPEPSPQTKSFLEIPIYTETIHHPTLYLKLGKKYRERTSWLNQIYPPASQPGTVQADQNQPSPSILQKIWELTLGKRTMMLDHGQLSAKHMVAMVKRIRKQVRHLPGDAILPVVSITHAKGAFFFDEFEQFLKQVKQLYGDEVVFISFAEANQLLRSLSALPAAKKQ